MAAVHKHTEEAQMYVRTHTHSHRKKTEGGTEKNFSCPPVLMQTFLSDNINPEALHITFDHSLTLS